MPIDTLQRLKSAVPALAPIIVQSLRPEPSERFADAFGLVGTLETLASRVGRSQRLSAIVRAQMHASLETPKADSAFEVPTAHYSTATEMPAENTADPSVSRRSLSDETRLVLEGVVDSGGAGDSALSTNDEESARLRDAWAQAEMVPIPAGEYMMGSPKGLFRVAAEMGREADEAQHRVRLSRSFLIQRTPVTQGQFKTFMGYEPSYFGHRRVGELTDAFPVEQIQWIEAVRFANALSLHHGLSPCYDDAGTVIVPGGRVMAGAGYRLPTEAEWEYAARSGNPSARYGAIGHVAWYEKNSRYRTHAVGSKEPNACGLYDMLGLVFEWCHDWYAPYETGALSVDPQGPTTGYRRVLRGGSWSVGAAQVRAAYRYYDGRIPSNGRDVFGFRLVRTLFDDD